MTNLPLDVLAIYAGLLIWVVLVVRDWRQQSFRVSLIFSLLLLVILNARYLIEGAADSIAFFVSIYDVFDNLGLAATDTAPAMATCVDNACSVWGERYLNHSSWGVAFHERFLNGPEFRSNLLYVHLTFNTIVFILMHIQLAKPGLGNAEGRSQSAHQLLGRISFACLTLGTICAVWLASEHDAVTEYGGALSKYGFWFMSACVYSCAVMGVLKIRKGDAASHRIWMIRFAGSMWGAFWVFRVMLMITGPLLREWESASILLSIWLSAPIGILIAECLRRYWERRATHLSAPSLGRAVGVSS